MTTDLKQIYDKLRPHVGLMHWLRPGLGLKRWFIPLFFGLVIASLGAGLFLRDLYASTTYPYIIRLMLLQDLPRWIRAVLFGSAGMIVVILSIFQLNRVVLSAFLPEEATISYIAEQLHRHRKRRRGGPKVVVIGGGTGLSALLRGLKQHTENITAIVTVADDGGSSGKLRRDLGVLPPGDFRNCIAALADDEALLTSLFQYRFRSGSLEGHSFGNLFITVMAEVTGSFEKALFESGRVLNIRGMIVPSTLQDVTLCAEVGEGDSTRKVRGESAIPESNLPIERVYLQPDSPPPFPLAIQAILDADLIVAGPGSLYTSVMPNLLVPELSSAIRASTAKKVYICNVATQPGETDNYSLHDHVKVINKHTAHFYMDGMRHEESLFGYVLANSNVSIPLPDANLQRVLPETVPQSGYSVVEVDVIDEERPWRHDSVKLANALMDWYQNQQK